jgi:hypothetical protein
MKKILSGLALLLFLLSSAAYAPARSYEDQLAEIFTRVCPQSQITWDEMVMSEDNSRLTFNQVVIIYNEAAAEEEQTQGKIPGEGREEERSGSSQRIDIDRVVLENPNQRLGLEEGSAPLARRIVSYGIRWQINDGSSSGVIKIKESVSLGLTGPWKDILSGQPLTPPEIAAQIAAIQTESLEISEFGLEGPDFWLGIDSIKARRLGIVNADNVRMSKIKIGSASIYPLSVDEINLAYDLRQPLPDLIRAGLKGWVTGDILLAHKFNFSLRLDKLRAVDEADNQKMLTIKYVTLEYKNTSSLVARLAINDFLLDWQASQEDIMRQLLKNKPLRFTLETSSEYKPGQFAPFSFDLKAPGLASLKLDGQASYQHLLPAQRFDILDRLESMPEDAMMDIMDIMENIRLKRFSLRYNDDGLIDAALAMYAQEEGSRDLGPARHNLATMLRNSAGMEYGFTKEFMLALARLIQKPGRLTLNLSAPQFMTFMDIVELTQEGEGETGKIKYDIKVN